VVDGQDVDAVLDGHGGLADRTWSVQRDDGFLCEEPVDRGCDAALDDARHVLTLAVALANRR
jgi:hypothetical protein